MNGLAIHKGQVIRNKNGDVVQQTFIYNLEWFRQDRGLISKQRKCGSKHETRCGYGAKFCMPIDINSGSWYIIIFSYEHNHDMLREKHYILLAAHRKLKKSNKIQINKFGKFKVKKLLEWLVHLEMLLMGYDKVKFLKKDVHNQIVRHYRNGNQIIIIKFYIIKRCT